MSQSTDSVSTDTTESHRPGPVDASPVDASPAGRGHAGRGAGDDEPAVLVRGLVKRFGDLTAVDGIDFEVRRGRCMGVLGPNGAGKTTTIEILEGLTVPDAGTVRVLGRAWDDDARAIQERIGVQLQETDFQDKLRVSEILNLFSSFYADTVPVDEIVAQIGLTDKRRALVKTLSGGQKQRLAVGCALLNRPEVLFLDEPTTGLDPQARRLLWDVVESFKAAGGTVMLTTHYMEEAERLADDLIVVDTGRIIARGTPAEIIASLGAESLVHVSFVGEAPDEVEAAALLAIDGVESTRMEGEAIVLIVTRTQAAIAGLFQHLATTGRELSDLRTTRPTLEDVFVALTGKQLRDG
ncbi:MAG: ABC transporter ATP-binding protein [Phycisphaerales bacterium]